MFFDLSGKKAENDPIENYYELHDKGCADDAPVVLFLPGVGCGAFLFYDAIEAFLPKYKVLLFNNPGLNGTQCPATVTVDYISAKVLEVLDHLKIEKVHVVAHSMGGFVAQQLALDAPERVMRMVVAGTSYGGPENQKAFGLLVTDISAWEFYANVKSAVGARFILSKSYDKRFPERFDRFLRMHRTNLAERKVIVTHFMCGSRFSSFRRINEITQPTLVIHGDQDRLVGFDSGKNLAHALPNARFMPLEHCGHVPFEEFDLWHDMQEFLQGNDSIGEAIPHKVETTAGFFWPFGF